MIPDWTKMTFQSERKTSPKAPEYHIPGLSCNPLSEKEHMFFFLFSILL